MRFVGAVIWLACMLAGPVWGQSPVVSFPAPWQQSGATVSLSVSNVSGRVALGWASVSPAPSPPPPSVRVCNIGTVTAYAVLGSSSVTATTAGFPVAAGACNLIALNGATYIAAITASSTTTITAQAGNGTPYAGGIGDGGGSGVYMFTGASNAVLPDARDNLGIDDINPVVAPYNADPTGVADSTAALQAAIDASITTPHGRVFVPSGTYKITDALSLPLKAKFVCANPNSTIIKLDDSTGLLDLFTAGAGEQSIIGCSLQREQAAKGVVGFIRVASGGTGYTTGDTVTLGGGTCSTTPVGTVTASAGVITSVAVTTPGLCSAIPAESADGLAATATSGGGSGAKFRLEWLGPAAIHLTDSYYVRLYDNRLGDADFFNQIRITASAAVPNQIFIKGNQIFNAANDGISVVALDASHAASDIFIQGRNYIQDAGHSAVAFYGNAQGVFVQDNTLYSSVYGIFADTQDLVTFQQSNTFTFNDVDANTARNAFLYGLGTSTLQLGHSFSNAGGLVECIACSNIRSGGTNYQGSAAGLILTGVNGWAEVGSLFAGMTAPITIRPNGATASNNISINANYQSGVGPLVTFAGAANPATRVSIIATLHSAATGLFSGTNVDSTTFSAVSNGYTGNRSSGPAGTILNYGGSIAGDLSSTLINLQSGSAARTIRYMGNSLSGQQVQEILNGHANSSGNGIDSFTIASGGRFVLSSNGNPGLDIATTGTSTIPAGFVLTAPGNDGGHTDATVCRDTTSGAVLTGTGAAGICLGTSSLRFKHDIRPLTSGLAQINAMEPIIYRYNKGYGDDGARDLYGFAAEQVVSVMPDLVGLDSEGKPNSVDWAGIVPVLVKAIQEQQEEINALKKKQSAP